MKKILRLINAIFYCITMIFLVCVITAFVVPIFLVVVAMQVIAFLSQVIWHYEIPDNIRWQEVPDALSEFICKLGIAFDIDLIGILQKLAKK